MKKVFTIVCITLGILLSGNSYGQKQESYKSLKSRSKITNTSELLKEANDLKDKYPSEALNKVQEVLALSIAQNDMKIFKSGNWPSKITFVPMN
jgi:hypothetical protein